MKLPIKNLLNLARLVEIGIPLIIDCSRSIEDMIRDGDYYQVDPIFKDDFGTDAFERSGKFVGRLIDFQSFKDVPILLEQKNCYPGKLSHLLAIGLQYPELQKHLSIVAPVVYFEDFGMGMMPCIGSESGSRVLRSVSAGDPLLVEMCVLGIQKN